MKNAKARRFALALKEWDEFKATLIRQFKSGKISEEEYNRALKAKARELDL